MPIGSARSISWVRGLRRSVTRGSGTRSDLLYRGETCRSSRRDDNKVERAGYKGIIPGGAVKLPVVVQHSQALEHIVRIRFGVLLLLIATSATAGAQMGRMRYGFNQPSAWVSLGAGYEQGFTIQNGSQLWDFGDGPQYVASLERNVSAGASLGIAATTARLPVRVSSGNTFTDADANVSQGFATLHFTNGGQFHTAFDLRAGATVYSSFTSRTAGQSTGVTGTDTDFSFALGYGFGYAFSPRFSLDVVQDVTTTVHQKDGLGAGTDNSVRLHTTRVIARFGLGGR